MKKSALIIVVLAILAGFALGCASKPISAQAPISTPTSKDASAKEKVFIPSVVDVTAKPSPTPSPVAPVPTTGKQDRTPVVINQTPSKDALSKNEMETLFKEASSILDNVLTLARKGKDIRNYVMVSADFAADASSDVTKNKLSKAEEIQIEDSRKVLLKKEKAKLTEISLAGHGDIGVKVCDKDGLCEGFVFTIDNSEGVWKIYEITPQKIGEFARSGSWSTTTTPFKLVESLFDLLSKNKVTEATKLLAQRQGTSTISVNGVAQRTKGLQVSTIERVYERTEEQLRASLVLWNPGGDSETKPIIFVKGRDGNWRILLDSVVPKRAAF